MKHHDCAFGKHSLQVLTDGDCAGVSLWHLPVGFTAHPSGIAATSDGAIRSGNKSDCLVDRPDRDARTVRSRARVKNCKAPFGRFRQAVSLAKGLNTGTPVGSKWRTLRVATVRPRFSAMAAICRSELV